jgi:hypothetical protein
MLEEKNDNLPGAEGKEEVVNETQESNVENPAKEATAAETTQEEAEAIDEIDSTNAEDAEDEENGKRHEIPMPDYHAMDMESLVRELEKLLKNEKVQAIKNHVDGIKSEFDLKYQELIEQKKEEFLADGGNEIDFHYSYPTKNLFNTLYKEYREKRNQYYQNLEQTLKANLANRLELIEELKGLINVEENINTTFKHFKEIQDKWRKTGPIPRVSYNDVWRTYHHHVERFYDFLDLNRDLRDLDFKHNLEEKKKLIARAEALLEENDAMKAFRELQTLHKVWKEDIGPVDREHREAIWEQFSNITKELHKKRQEYFKNLDQVYEDNLVRKQEIISKIQEIANSTGKSHGVIQKQIKEIEALREAFFNAGRVPRNVNEQTWAAFKEAVRTFNRNKNAFYKNLKKNQHENLEKKLALVKKAEELKDSEDWESTTPIMKKIQADWKQIGHVPRKYSDKIWEEFKAACNHYFDRLHAQRNEANKEEFEAFENKKAFLDKLKEFKLSGDKEKDLNSINNYIEEWKGIGRVPFNKRNIEAKFNKILDALFKKTGLDPQEAELLKYDSKLDQLSNAQDDRLLQNERTFIRRKIDEVKNEIRQLENNLQFINADDSNPIVKDVRKNIAKHEEALAVWKAKLSKIRSL